MSDTLVLFLSREGVPARWLRVADERVDARGDGLPTIDPAADEQTRLVAVAPADGVTLHWAVLPDRSLPQAVAAARLAVAEASAASLGDLHVAVGREDAAEERPIAVVGIDRMQRWLAELAAAGFDPDVLVPAPMLLPRPDDGYVRADLGAGVVVRGPTSGFADEPPLTDLLTGGAVPDTIGRDALELAIARAAVAPALDLRQGPFARRRRTGIDWRLVRRLGWLAVAILTVTLLISLMRILRYDIATDATDAQVDRIAQTGLPPGAAVTDADRQLGERLTALRGGGLGFSRTAAAVFAAIQGVPGSELTALDYGEDGTLTATVSIGSEADATALVANLAANGLTATPGTFTASGGRLSGQLTVTP